MTVLDHPPKGWKRPFLPDGVKFVVLRRQATAAGKPLPDPRCNLPEQVRELEGTLFGAQRPHYDHRPPLFDRKFDTEINDTIPRANSADHIEAISREDHDHRTHGPGGEKRITTRGSDTDTRKRRNKRERAQAPEPPAFVGKVRLINVGGWQPKRTIRSAGFDQRFTRKLPSNKHPFGQVVPRKGSRR